MVMESILGRISLDPDARVSGRRGEQQIEAEERATC